MAVRKATARWQGGLKTGSGAITLESGVLSNTAYSFTGRFEGGMGTNPEELLGAAHAGCFAMALNASLERNNTPADYVQAEANVHLTPKPEGGGSYISKIVLVLDATVPGIDEAKFHELAEAARANCIISAALAGVPEITLETTFKN
ncbi:MAG: OsmC family protein [Phototrophicaceae bacterium]